VSCRSIAFVPAAPLLIPSVAGGSADRDAELRAAAVAAVRTALAAAPDRVLVVAPTPVAYAADGDLTWDFGGFGVDRRVVDRRPRLPWQLGVGAWLLDECGWSGPRSWLGAVQGAEPPAEFPPGVFAVVAVGDGSARRSEKAPGHLDPRAEAFDLRIAAALRDGDVAALATVDAGLATEVMCHGLPVWQWVSRLVDSQAAATTAGGPTLHVAPYGVGYFVESWLLD